MPPAPGTPPNTSAGKPGRQTRGLGPRAGSADSPCNETEPRTRWFKTRNLGGVLRVPVGDIMPNPLSTPRHHRARHAGRPGNSIRQHGLIQPLIITRSRPTDPVP